MDWQPVASAAATISSGVTRSPTTESSSVASCGHTGSFAASLPDSSRLFGSISLGHWEICQFWQKEHRRLQPTVAME